MPKDRNILVIATFRAFDEAAWRRLIIAYAYALHDRRQRQAVEQQKEVAQEVNARQEGTA